MSNFLVSTLPRGEPLRASPLAEEGPKAPLGLGRREPNRG